MRLNGETKTLKDPVALSDFLTQEGFSDKRIAVERNGEIVPKGEYANDQLTKTRHDRNRN